MGGCSPLDFRTRCLIVWENVDVVRRGSKGLVEKGCTLMKPLKGVGWGGLSIQRRGDSL